jgi:hypothetical protein
MLRELHEAASCAPWGPMIRSARGERTRQPDRHHRGPRTAVMRGNLVAEPVGSRRAERMFCMLPGRHSVSSRASHTAAAAGLGPVDGSAWS